MIDFKSNLLLLHPIKFYDVCTIYPPSIEDILDLDDKAFNFYLLPYMITNEIFKDRYNNLKLLEIIFKNKELFNNLIISLYWFCKTDNIKFRESTCDLFINDSENSLNVDNFDEFSNIILTSCSREKYKEEVEVEPKFETEDGRQRWLKLKAMREKHNKKNEENFNLSNIINLVQLGSNFYIPEENIKKWSLYKLTNTYISIINKDNSGKMFDIYTQTGDKKLIKESLSEILKAN